MDSDLTARVVDEIALEGLAGITLSSLWVRLNVSLESLDANESDVQEYLWQHIICVETRKGVLQMFQLAQPRPTLELYNRYEKVSADTSSYVEDPDLIQEDIYGDVTPVAEEGICGSCNGYNERVDVTLQVCDVDYAQVCELFGHSLVLVANQSERSKALMSGLIDPFLELTPIHYCILERIGRYRALGEVTVGKEAGKYQLSPKTLFYYRKKLIKHKLIKKQQCVVYNVKSMQNLTGSIFTLTRFYNERLTPMEVSARHICAILVEQEDYECEFNTLREKLGLRLKQYKLLLGNFTNNFTIIERDSTKFVKLIKMIGKDDDNEKEEEEFDEDEDEGERESLNKGKCFYDASKILADRPLLAQVLTLIETWNEANGITQTDIRRALCLPKLDVRMMAKSLEKSGHVKVVMEERGRQKVSTYIPKCKIQDAQSLFDRARGILPSKKTDTLLHLERSNIILDYVNQVKIVDNLFELRKLIIEKEKANNLPHQVDTKSVQRIVSQLAAQGIVRSIKTVFKCEDVVKRSQIVCVPSITQDDPIIKERIEQCKFKFSNMTGQERQSDDSINENVWSQSNASINLVYQPSVGRRYGVEPKMKKLLTLYKFLFHLTYDSFSTETKFINDSDLWRINIDPLPIKSNTCTLGDLIPRMPLSIFTKIVFITYIIPGMEEYLCDPIKVNNTLSQFPPSFRQCLLYKRKYLFNIFELLTSLCYLGLVEINYKEGFPKESTVITVKNSVSLNINRYKFTTMSDVDDYIENLTYHCMNDCNSCPLDPRLYAHNSRNWTFSPSVKDRSERDLQRLKNLSNLKSVSQASTSGEHADGDTPGTLKRGNSDSKELPGTRKKQKKNKNDSAEKAAGKKRQKGDGKRKRINFDKIDLQARKRMKKHRADWTSEEDAFLMVSKITSALMNLKCNKNIKINKNVTRDALHQTYPNVARDKTGQACNRRIQYMLKNNPQTRQNVNEWVAELMQDELFNANIPESGIASEEVTNKTFLELLYRVLKKIQSPYIQALEVAINVNSIEDLLSKYVIRSSHEHVLPANKSIHEDARNIVDIHVNVVTNILVSSLLSKSFMQEETEFHPELLFKIYQRYPDTLVRSVVTKMSKQGVICKLKNYKHPTSQLLLRSLNGSPYKITRSYLFSLQTKLNLDSLLTKVPFNGDVNLTDASNCTSNEVAMITNLFSSRNSYFQVEIPENFVLLDEQLIKMPKSKKSLTGSNLIDPKSASRFALHILRKQINELPSDRIQHIQDYLMINQCKVSCKSYDVDLFPKEKLETLVTKEERLVGKSHLPLEDLTFQSRSVLQSIENKREIGASCEEIIVANGGTWPEDDMTLLITYGWVYRVGIKNFKWVHVDYISPWTVQTTIPKLRHSNSEEVESESDLVQTISRSFISRYWKKPDGSVDRCVLLKLVNAVMSHIMLFPGITQSKLMDHFNRILQPVQLMEVIEFLVSSECVEIILMEEIKKPKLFESVTQHSEYFVTHYESTSNAFINLCRLKTLFNM